MGFEKVKKEHEREGEKVKKLTSIFRVFLGVFCVLMALGGVIAATQERQPAMLILAAVFGGLAVLLLRRKKVEVKPPQMSLDVIEPPQPVDAYVSTGSIMYRTDGKPIEDREVPHLIEMGFRELQERPVGVPPDATADELRFFAALDAALFAAGKPRDYKATRMSNGAISVSSGRAYLGKIKLKGRKTWMQYIKRSGNAESVSGLTLEEYIALIPRWVKTA